jgi:5-hydroxyisourate hydrolase-like protein (transthyretin family)
MKIMKRVILPRVIFFILFLCGFQTLFGSGELTRLKVLGRDSLPLASANVELVNHFNQAKERFDLTDKKGECFSAFPGGDKSLVIVRHEDYAPQPLCDCQPEKFLSTNPLMVNMEKGKPLSGNITYPDGERKGEARLLLTYVQKKGDHTHYFFSMEKKKLSGEESFTFPQLPKGEYRLRVEGENLVSLEETIWNHHNGKKNDEFLNLQVASANLSTLSFLSDKGGPAKYLMVKMSFHREKVKGWDKTLDKNHRRYWSDEQGKFRAPIPRGGYVSVLVIDQRFKGKHVLNIPSHELEKAIALEKKKSVSGIILDAKTRKPLSGVTVVLSKKRERKNRRPFTFHEDVMTQKDGRFSFVCGKDQPQALRAWAKGYFPGGKKELKGFENQKYEVLLEQGEGRRFRFLQPIPNSDPALVSNYKIKVYWRTGGVAFSKLYMETDINGVIEIPGIEKGDTLAFRTKAFIEIFNSPNNGGMEEILRYKPGETMDILLKPNTEFFVKVSSAGDGKELTRNHYVVFYWKKKRLRAVYDKKMKAFKVSQLPIGEHEIRVGHHQHEDNTIVVNAMAGESSNYEITLPRKSGLTIELLPKTAKIPENITLTLDGPPGRFSIGRSNKSRSKDEKNLSSLYRDNLWEYETITISVPGYLPKTYDLPQDEPTDYWLKVQLEKGIELMAEVVDESGLSVPKVKVRLSRKNLPSQEYVTGEQGEVSLGGLEKATYSVDLSSQEYASSKTELEVVSGVERPRWVLKKGMVLSATVQTDGVGVEGIEVAIAQKNEWGHFNEYFDGRPGKQKSGEDGAVSFKNLSPGEYRLKVHSEEHGLAESDLVIIDEHYVDPFLILELKKGVGLEGRVVDEEGEAIDEISISIYSQMGGGDHMNTKSGRDGSFEFRHLKEGVVYVLNISNNQWELKKEGQYLVKAGGDRLEVVVRPRSKIRVKVMAPDGTVVEKSAKIFISRKSWSHFNELYNSKCEDGVWFAPYRRNQFGSWGPGGKQVRLRVQVKGFGPGKSDWMPLEEVLTKVHQIRLSESEGLSFKIYDGYGQLLPKVKALAYAEKGGVRVEGISDKEGVVDLMGMEKGPQMVSFEKDGYAKHQVRVSFDPSVDMADQSITLTPGGSLKGVVLDHEGQARAKAHVWLRRKNSSRGQNQHSETTKKDGTFTFSHVSPGEYIVGFNSDRYDYGQNRRENQTVEIIESQESEIELKDKKLENAGSLRITISKGMRGRFNSVMLNTPSGMGGQKQFFGSEVTFDQLVEAEYNVILFGNGSMRNETAKVVAGEEAHLDLNDDDRLKVIAKVLKSDGTPFPMCSAFLINLDQVDMINPNQSMKAMNGMGMVRLGGLEIMAKEPGRFRLMLQVQQGDMAGLQQNLGDVEILPSGTTDLGTLRVEDGKTLSILVKDEMGQAIEGAGVVCIKDKMPQAHFSWRTGPDGRLELNNLPNPPFNLIVNHNAYTFTDIEVHQLIDHDVVMKKGIEVSITLTGENVSNRRVQLVKKSSVDGEHESLKPYQGFGHSSPVGGLRFKHVSLGRYYLLVHPLKPNGRTKETESFEVVDGGGEISLALP